MNNLFDAWKVRLEGARGKQSVNSFPGVVGEQLKYFLTSAAVNTYGPQDTWTEEQVNTYDEINTLIGELFPTVE